jgi:hypothetical protein
MVKLGFFNFLLILQNGEDDSGRSNGGIHWQEPANVNRTIKDLGMIANLSLAVNAAAK